MKTQEEILGRYNSLVADYANKVMPSFDQNIDKQRMPYNEFLKYLFDFYLFMSYLVDNGLMPKDTTHTAFRVLYSKAALSLLGAHTCLSKGLVTVAAHSLRTLFEVFVNCKLILEKDTANRLQLFADFEAVEQWNHLQANMKLLDAGKLAEDLFDSQFSATAIARIDSRYAAIKSNYHPKLPQEDIFRDKP